MNSSRENSSEPRPIRVLALMEALSVTGPAKNLLQFARACAPAAELRIATYPRGAAARNNPFICAAREAGIPLEIIPERRRFDWRVPVQFRSAALRLRPDILQSHNIKSHLFVRLSGLYRRIPWVAFHHGYTWKNLADRLYSQVDRFSLRAAQRIVTVCRPFAAQIRGYGIPAERISVLHNAVSPFTPPPAEMVNQVRERFGLPAEIPLILAVGRLSREKGYRDLLAAVAALRRDFPALPFRLALVGEGPDRADLERLITTLDLAAATVLCGHQADVRPFYAAASLLALPSHTEGSPNALLEAMAAGVPAVATTAGGIPEIAADNETALLVPIGDPPALARALARLLKQPALAQSLAVRARRDVLANHTPEKHRERILELYRELLYSQPGIRSYRSTC